MPEVYREERELIPSGLLDGPLDRGSLQGGTRTDSQPKAQAALDALKSTGRNEN